MQILGAVTAPLAACCSTRAPPRASMLLTKKGELPVCNAAYKGDIHELQARFFDYNSEVDLPSLFPSSDLFGEVSRQGNFRLQIDLQKRPREVHCRVRVACQQHPPAECCCVSTHEIPKPKPEPRNPKPKPLNPRDPKPKP